MKSNIQCQRVQRVTGMNQLGNPTSDPLGFIYRLHFLLEGVHHYVETLCRRQRARLRTFADKPYLAREIYGWLCSLSRSESGNPPRAGEGEESARGGDSTLGRSQKSGRHLDTWAICVLRAYEGREGTEPGVKCCKVCKVPIFAGKVV